MALRKLVTAIAALGWCITSLAAQAAHPLTYRVTHIITQVFDPQNPFEIPVSVGSPNDKGELIGWRPETGPFLWHDGTFEPLNLPGTFPQPTAINDRSQVAGVCQTDPQFRDRACLLTRDDQFVVVPALPGEIAASAHDLSNRGHVLGDSLNQQGIDTIFVWRRGKFTILDPLPGFEATFPVQINERGTIAVGDASGRTQGIVPVIWQQDGTVMQIELPPGGVAGQARDVNNRGTVVFDVFFPGALPRDAHNTAQVWREGELTPLDPPGDQYQNTAVWRINNRGVITGQSWTFQPPTLLFVATIWRDGIAEDLNLLISDADPLKPFVSLTFARGINDRGQIVAEGQDSRDSGARTSYYLLTPVHTR